MPSSVKDHASGVVAQPTSIVHARAMEVANVIASRANAWQPDKDMAKWLGLRDGVGFRLKERRDGSGFDVDTNKGRVRARAKMRIEPQGVDQSEVTIDLEIRPAGIDGRLLWWVADRFKFFDDPEMTSHLIPHELIEILGASEAEWAEGQADLQNLFSDKL